MIEKKLKKNCFIIMPITTPENWVADYQNDKNHFEHVLNSLFIPALKKAGFNPIRPTSEGSSIIHVDIINGLTTAELVLCDMSTWNPNVFLEFGIRIALNKPVALVADEKIHKYPFDISPIQCHRYESSIASWLIEDQKKQLTNHVKKTFEKSPDLNPLWTAFNIQQTGNIKFDSSSENKLISLLLEQNRDLRSELNYLQLSLPTERIGFSGYSGEKKNWTVADLLAKQQMEEENRKNKQLSHSVSGYSSGSQDTQQCQDRNSSKKD